MATDLGASGGPRDPGGATENAYEKLSREVHQMQITGAIHSDWLENPKGYLQKPDFKRKAQHVGAGGKKLNSSRVLRLHLPGSTYRSRWFVLDGMILRYFKSEAEEQELGAIHLASVNAVLPSSVADAPEHALDLVCADRIYTIAGNNREDMVRWATVLTLVLRGEYKPKLMQRPESTIIRGSSVIPRPTAIARKTAALTQGSRFTDANGMRMTSGLADDPDGKGANDDFKEKIITVTFDQPGPLHLILRGTVDDEVMVCGFEDPRDGNAMGPAEASGAIRVGDILISINSNYFTNIEFKQAIEMLGSAGRPLTLRFSRIEHQTTTETNRVAEGWVLAKEPAAHRYRIRMLQLNGDRLRLFKPSMQGGRVDEPCMTIPMEDVRDIRPTNDSREVVSALTQCHPKQWGVTLEGTRSIFTFYTKDRQDMLQWVDLLKNSPLFSAKATQLSIPVHPISVVEFYPALEPRKILEDDVGKMGDLVPTFAVHRMMLLEDGKLMYYTNKDFAASRLRPIGILRCDAIVGIVPSQVTDGLSKKNSFVRTSATSSVSWSDMSDHNNNSGEVTEDMMPWRLELGVLMQGAVQKYRRSFVLCFDTHEKMMKWGICIGQEAKRLTGQEYDLSSVTRRASRSNSSAYPGTRSSDMPVSRPAHSRLMLNSLKYVDPNIQVTPPLFRSLKDVTLHTATKGWFYVRKPQATGFTAYHPRFVVLKEHELLLFKYEVHDSDSLHSYASMLDLRTIKDVREAESGYLENLDFTIRLTTKDDIMWMLVAETYAQKETWLSTLIWISDYYYDDAGINFAEGPRYSTKEKILAMKNAGLMSAIPEADEELMVSHSMDNGTELQDDRNDAAANIMATLLTVTEFSGMLQVSGMLVFATISDGVFSYYANEDDYDNEWGDALDAISLKEIEEVHSDGVDAGSFVVKVKGEVEVQLVAESAKYAKRWMLVMCSCGGLILKKAPSLHSWVSTPPKEAWVWKLDRLYQIFRRRYFSLRNHQLLFFTEPGGRPLGMISLPCIYHLRMTKVCTRSKDEADFYQLEISFAIPKAVEASSQVGDFYAFLLAFDTQPELLDWAHAIYDCCTNSMSVKANATLPPLEPIQVLPKELLKTCEFDNTVRNASIEGELEQQKPAFSASGWLYYRTSSEERIRLRYFVQWGYELSIYKHEILADEASSIRYGVIDCRALTEVRFAYVNAPENAVELVLGSDVSVILIPRTDEEAVMWHDSLVDVKRAYGQLESGMDKDALGAGVFISRGSTFSTHKDNEELLRMQIESAVVSSANLQEWDDRKWIPKYFVLTSSRVLVLSLALHLYDEEPDILGSFAAKDIVEVRSCNDAEEAEISCKSACVITLNSSPVGTTTSSARAGSFNNALPPTQERMVIKCDSEDYCLEWMRLLCSCNGKLELKKNAATGLWGSVNRVASLSRHQSFMMTTPLPSTNPLSRSASSDGVSKRMSRQDAARRRTSELIMNRKMSQR